jgi:DNA-binding LytR/AlgR family response regulator
MRLGDAIDELAPLDGMRVHRSWWVARVGVERVKRSGERLSLILRSGAEAPVARGSVRVLKDAGWIRRHLPRAEVLSRAIPAWPRAT